MKKRDVLFGSMLLVVIISTTVFIVANGNSRNLKVSEHTTTQSSQRSESEMKNNACAIVDDAADQRGVYTHLGIDTHFMICLQNGWTLNMNNPSTALYTAGISDLVLRPSQDSQINKSGTAEGPFRLTIAISPPETFNDDWLSGFKQIAAPESEEPGTVIWAYTKVAKAPTGASGPDALPEGTEQHRYVIESDSSNGAMHVAYDYVPDEPDYRQAIVSLVTSAHTHLH